MTLYEIQSQYVEFLQMIADGDVPEEAIKDTLDSLQGELDEKVDNIASYIKNLSSEAIAIREEEKALAERRQAKEAKIDNLKAYLSNALLLLGRDVVETPRNRVSFRRSKSLSFTPEAIDALGGEWFKVTKELKKKELADAIKAGESFDGICLQEKKNIQIK